MFGGGARPVDPRRRETLACCARSRDWLAGLPRELARLGRIRKRAFAFVLHRWEGVKLAALADALVARARRGIRIEVDPALARPALWVALRLSLALLFGVARVEDSSAQPSAADTAKKLIEFGWDEPDPRFMREHIAQLLRTPFDGCVFHLTFRNPSGRDDNFAWRVWSRGAFPDSAVQRGLDDLRATRFGRFRYNFLRINVTPANFDWFDDHGAVLHNVNLAARVARAAGCPGLLFDTEPYQKPLWWYEKQRDTTAHGWDGYAAQAHRRGREVIEAMQAGYPDLTVILTFGYSMSWEKRPGGLGALRQSEYGLLAPFLDGMFAGARGRTTIVDGYEQSYGYRDTTKFTRAYHRVRFELLPIVADTAAYARHLSVGFGLWMDLDWKRFGWDTLATDRNFFTPAAFERAECAALRTADRYVWVYTEAPRWWSEAGKPVQLPAAYDSAVRHPRR